MTHDPPLDFEFIDPRSVTVNLPPKLAALVALACAKTGVSPQALIIDLLDDNLRAEIVDMRHAVSAA